MCLAYNSIIEEVIFFFSLIFSFTLLLSSLVAVCSQDIKKVVALSTLSQLSFMILTLSLGIPLLAFFHLLTHAMFKSCLFLRVGAVIHLSFGSQELRKTTVSLRGGARMAIMLLSLLALTGVTYYSAYYSKEYILLIGFRNRAP